MIGQFIHSRRELQREIAVVLFLIGIIAVQMPAWAAGVTGPSALGAREPEPLQTVALPEVGHLHSVVRRQIGEAYRSLLPVALDPVGSSRARSEAFGELGKLFMAADFLRHAEQCLGNAQVLSPGEFRWPYYLGHARRRMGDLERAAMSFERALDLRPTDLAATVWLSRAHRELGRTEVAGTLVDRMLARLPGTAALRVEAGRIALAMNDYASAVEHLETALALAPEATSVHYPLAMAYRHLEGPGRARRHLRRWRENSPGAPVRLPDPLMAALNGVLRNPQYFRDLAFHAVAAGDWALAAAHFRTAVGAAPTAATLRLNLGMALERLGDIDGAEAALRAALRLDPRSYGAHYALGALLARGGRDSEAIYRFEEAVLHNPNFPAAHLALADTLRRTTRLEPSVASYRRVIELDPGNAAARFGEAMALVRLQRHAAARDRLIQAAALHPGRTEFRHALARLLAAAPDERIRNGTQALELMRTLVTSEQTTAVAETMAMTLAELGLFAEAVEWQRSAMAIAAKADRPDVAQRMATNLQLYLRRQPCRAPWRDDDPDHVPGPPAEPGLDPGR